MTTSYRRLGRLSNARSAIAVVESTAEAEHFLDRYCARAGCRDFRFLLGAFVSATRHVELYEELPTVFHGSANRALRLANPTSHIGVVARCYGKFDIESDTPSIFTRETLSTCQCTIEDLEEPFGFLEGGRHVSRS